MYVIVHIKRLIIPRVVITDLSGKAPHRQLGMGRVVTENLGGLMV